MVKNLLGYDFNIFHTELSPFVGKSFHIKQIYQWVYKKRVLNINDFTDLSKNMRKKLSGHFSFSILNVLSEEVSSEDGSRKYLLELEDGKKIETVFIPQKDRISICLSSQVGCKFGCKFCVTGLMGFHRNLGYYEIVSQLITVLVLNRERLKNRINLVFMGMGEPLDNYDNVKKAIEVISDPEGISISPKRITVSTIGITSYLKRFLEELPDVKLAFSLNSPFPSVRKELMPVEKRYPFAENMKILRRERKKLKHRVTFEYIMLKGVNDRLKDAKEILTITKGIPRKINLIPFNYFEGSELYPTEMDKIDKFAGYLRKYRVVVTIRDSKGKDIKASCGNLFAKLERGHEIMEIKNKD